MLLLRLLPLSAVASSHADMPIIQAVMYCHQCGSLSVASGGSDDAKVEPKEYLAAPTVSITANEVPVGKLLLLSSWLLQQLNHGKLIHLPCKVSRHSESMSSCILMFFLSNAFSRINWILCLRSKNATWSISPQSLQFSHNQIIVVLFKHA